MSSVAKGSRFETRIYEHFQRLISDGEFFATPDCCRIYRQKRYYSRDREADITFDIAIEVFLPGSDEHFLLVLIECKDYQDPVPVSDVESLFSRMQQVSGGNTKGIIVATSSFQSAAMGFARSKGIGVMRWFDKTDVKWLLKRTPASWGFRGTDLESSQEVHRSLSLGTYPNPSYEFYCWNNDKGTNSIAEMLSDTIRAHITPELARSLLVEPVDEEIVPYRTRESIDDLALELLGQVGYLDGRVSLESICEQQRGAVGLRFEHRPPTQQELSQKTLGHIDFDLNTITIFDLGPQEVDRQRFTLAHELGHYCLRHGDILKSESCQDKDIDDFDESPRRTNRHLRRLEIQANHFASSLLLPAKQIFRDMNELAKEFGLRNKGNGLIYLDSQPCNRLDHLRITHRLRLRYGASRTAVTYRLKELGLLGIADTHRLLTDI